MSFQLCFAVPTVANNCCSSTESTPRIRPPGETTDQGNNNHPLRGKTWKSCISVDSQTILGLWLMRIAIWWLYVLFLNNMDIELVLLLLLFVSFDFIIPICLVQFCLTFLKYIASLVVSLILVLEIICRNLRRWTQSMLRRYVFGSLYQWNSWLT